jgi:hypothetical protein
VPLSLSFLLPYEKPPVKKKRLHMSTPQIPTTDAVRTDHMSGKKYIKFIAVL